MSAPLQQSQAPDPAIGGYAASSRIGFVGLGVMGAGIAARLLRAGHEVTGWNRTKSKAAHLVDAGMQWAGSPRDAAEAADVVFSMVTDGEALHAVADGSDGVIHGLRPESVYVDMSTVSPAASRDLARRVADLGAHMLDAPVSGSVTTLQAGRLSIMVGGEPDAFERVLPILRSIGSKVTHVGPNGQAVLMKIAINLSLAVQMLAFSEGVLLAEKGGVDRRKAVDVLLESVIASPMVAYRGPFVLEMPEEAWFNAKMMQKDLLLALELGRELEVPLPTTSVTNEMLTTSRAMGYADEDFAVVFRTLARMAGVDPTGQLIPATAAAIGDEPASKRASRD